MNTPEFTSNIQKSYDPKSTEKRIYAYWENNGYFKPKIDFDKKPFVMIMPPPNVTGQLHMGHALTLAIEDMMVRWHRMLGEPTLYLPGTDHAGIATQVVVEKLIALEGLSRHDLGREDFEKRIWTWVEEYGSRIYTQFRRLGASCDWSRETFTLDKGPRNAVRKTFVDLYKKGLIYQGERISNRCPRCATALSDLEVKYKNVKGFIYKIKYLLTNGSGHIVIATTRPETMMGDMAIAVNTNDTRFEKIVGETVWIPLTNKKIPIIGDDAVDMEFGTGALKVTPAHDQTDFEIGTRHNLPIVNVISENGIMNENAGSFAGLDRIECKQKVIAELEQNGHLVESVEYEHSVGFCDRCDDLIEPLISKQWYVSIKPLAEPAIEAVRTGKIKIIPERFSNVYFNWMNNIKDWSVSRQLWWGHQLPVWYCDNCLEVIVEIKDPSLCLNCGSKELTRDPDVLDTWFSSGLWPHSTLGWPEVTKELNYFYPGSVLETGYDILFFWVARMIMMGIQNMGDIPFETVYLHGLVLDTEGVKMSKTKGNVLDPLELIDTYGADAVRFALTTGTSAGNNVRINENKLEASRNFNNKLWNASRFVIFNINNAEIPTEYGVPNHKLHIHDEWILTRLEILSADVNKLMTDYQFSDAQTLIHDFVWNEYCDWYIELCKLRLSNSQEKSPIQILSYVLEQILRLLHPFLPFVTEEIWSNLSSNLNLPANWPSALIEAKYPISLKDLPKTFLVVDQMNSIFELIRSIRNVRSELKIPIKEKLKCEILTTDHIELLLSQYIYIKHAAGLEELEIINVSKSENNPDTISIATELGITTIYIGNSINIESEIKRLISEQDEVKKHLKSLRTRLDDPNFTSKAPEEIIEKEKMRMIKSEERLQNLSEILDKLSD
jgi:valyl-tRNA synthetase